MAFLLPQSFYARDALMVARELIGKFIVRDDIILRISETEAYRWPDDSASHCFKGKTKRNSPMFGAPGHTYVYLCYGLHNMLNIVSNNEGEGAGVLIRSCEIYAGHKIIYKRRGRDDELLTGPGKIGQALRIDRTWNGHAFYEPSGLEIQEGPAVDELLVGPRVGIDYAEVKDRLAPYRFADAFSQAVSEKLKLRPEKLI